MNEFKIGNIKFKNDLVLAPMAGYSDVGLRYLARKYGASLTCTEMISAKALVYGNKKTIELLSTTRSEHPCAVQLFGSDPDVFYKAVKLKALDKFDIIDINMGCPAPKIYNNGEGSALLQDIPLAQKIVKACKRATSRPVTVKMRSGIDENHIVAKEFALAMQQAGADAITLHARTKEQGYSGKVDYELVKDVKDAISIPLIVSGDCTGRESYEYIKKITGADAVMIGRGAIGHPEVFAEILGESKKVNKMTDIKKHIQILSKYYPEKFIVLNLRGHIPHYIKGRGVDTKTKLELMKCETIKELLVILKRIFK